MILFIDNYDSFTYNLVQLAGKSQEEIKVIRNDAITVDEIRALNPSHLIISPGPGYPIAAGISEEAIKAFSGKIPILGVCLGHQAICESFGGDIIPAKRLMHGKKSDLTIDNTTPLFTGLPNVIEAARYHSLIAKEETIPEVLEIIARDDIGEVMGVRHRTHPTYGRNSIPNPS